MDEADPRRKWRQLPERIRPDQMVAEVDAADYDSTLDADAGAEQREARWLLERGGGLGG